MTVDERLEKLTERHEALTQSVELLAHEVSTLAREMDSLRVSSLHLVATAREDGQSIRALARIAEIHERRITDMEGGPAQ
ncbi:MAG: hypothetical protein ACR2I2_08105 [Bryobacteraceae bacterium]